MSRIGKKIREIPQGVTVEVKGDEIVVKGPKGELQENLHSRVVLVIENETVKVEVRNPDNKKDRSLWGTYSSLVNNMILGVTEGYKKELEVNGVGYKVAMKGKDLELIVGYSHPVLIKEVEGVAYIVDKNKITIEGINKQKVGEMAAQIRAVRKPEPYKGKGIKYMDEVIRRKVGKTAAKAA